MAHPKATAATGQGLEGGAAGSRLSFLVTPCDRFGNVYTSWPLTVEVEALLTPLRDGAGGSRQLPLAVEADSLANGSYVATYSSEQVGAKVETLAG